MGACFVLLFSLGLFVLTSGLLAMGLHRYRSAKSVLQRLRERLAGSYGHVAFFCRPLLS